MRIRKMLIALAVIVLLLAVGSCASSSNSDGSVTFRETADMFKEGGAGSLTINNQASFDVIVFAGSVASNNVLGGIRAGKSRNFDISKLNLPARNGSFLIRAASFETYRKNNLRIKEENVLYTGLVVYDLRDPKDRTNLNIFAGIRKEEDTYIYVNNTSKLVLELRLNNPNGEKIATLAPLQENKKVYLTPPADGLEYNFYATYVYIDPATNEITSFLAKDRSERQSRIPRSSGVNPMSFSGPKNTSEISYLVGFLKVRNDTQESLRFMNGTQRLPDQRGNRLVESGEQVTIELSATSGDMGELYTNLNMEFDSTKVLRIDRLSVRPGVQYDCVISLRNGNPVYDIRETGYKDKLNDMRVSLFLGD